MLNVLTTPAASDAYHAFRDPGTIPAPAKRRVFENETRPARLLADYLEGWAEADPVKIADATSPDYRFEDPFVGTFPTVALPRYFAALRSRNGLGALASRQYVSFLLRGPMDTEPVPGTLEFWREAPRLGLTGTSLITVGPRGVISERVAYDLNMASEQLRHSRAHC